MAKWGKCDFRDLEKLQKQLERMEKQQKEFCESCAKELAGILLREVGLRTPVGEYKGGVYECKARKGPKLVHYSWKKKGLSGGTLRRAWSAGEIRRNGSNYEIEIINPTEYASYVEFGHRTANHKGWVKGHFMLTISEKEIQRMAPKFLEKKLQKFLEECLDAE